MAAAAALFLAATSIWAAFLIPKVVGRFRPEAPPRP
jgi:hypothetical protein